MKKLLFVLVSLALVAAPVQARKVKGRVSSEGAPLGNVIVSDGYHFTTTRADGTFALNTHKDARFVFVVTPSGYVADFSSGAPQFYLPLKGTRSFAFDLQHVTDSPDYALLSISDPQMANKKHLKRFMDRPLGDLRGMAERCRAERQTVAVALGDIGWNQLELHPQ